jgi:broad specificity phosphatase PhoE
MPTRLTLVRHGHTEWNQLGRYQGHAPTPLSARGLTQVSHLAEALAGDATIAAIYSSDLLRCRQTAMPIAAPHGLPVHTDPRFREMNYGNWQGLTAAELAELDAEHFSAYRRDPAHTQVPGGESQRLLAARVLAGLDDVLRAEAGRHVVLVSHGGPLREVLRHFDLWEGGRPADNASRTVIDVAEDRQAARLVCLGDMSHLPPDLRPDASGTSFLVR